MEKCGVTVMISKRVFVLKNESFKSGGDSYMI